MARISLVLACLVAVIALSSSSARENEASNNQVNGCGPGGCVEEVVKREAKRPDQSRKKRGQTRKKPGQSRKKPGQSRKKPGQSQRKPGQSRKKPGQSRKKPGRAERNLD
jgi:hypothetical protein